MQRLTLFFPGAITAAAVFSRIPAAGGGALLLLFGVVTASWKPSTVSESATIAQQISRGSPLPCLLQGPQYPLTEAGATPTRICLLLGLRTPVRVLSPLCSTLPAGLWLCFLAHRILHGRPAPDPDAPWPPLLLYLDSNLAQPLSSITHCSLHISPDVP